LKQAYDYWQNQPDLNRNLCCFDGVCLCGKNVLVEMRGLDKSLTFRRLPHKGTGVFKNI
tara:strand:+ start:377 stop:553 length:177 start_codon:yes stop_codon:yes gene_type:complete